MENRAHALAAGLFTVLLGLAAALGVWWLSGKRDAMSEYVLVSRGSVSGLNPQAQVRYRGIRAGKVLDIDLDPKDPRNILVVISVDADIPITRGTTAELNYQGVTGLAYVHLKDKGDDPTPLRGEGGRGDERPRIVLDPSMMDELGDAAVALVGRMRRLADRAEVLLSDNHVERLGRTLAHVESASAGLDRSMRDAPPILAGLKKALSDDNLKRLAKTLENLERTSGEAAPLAADLRGLIGSLRDLGRKLDALSSDAGGEVVQATLPRLNALLQELSVNSRQMGRILDQIEESPNMLIFGRAAQRPGPGETGHSAQ